MHPVIARTLGRLSIAHYIRHFVFGLIFPALIFVASRNSPTPLGVWFYFALCAVLYPYARHAYETLADFMRGRVTVITGLGLLMAVKFVTMGVCFVFAPLIAPLGLAWLYVQQGKAD